jgi:hypothetical protein
MNIASAIGLASLSGLNIWAFVRCLNYRYSSRSQKTLQMLFVWCFPVVGSALVLSVLGEGGGSSARADTTSGDYTSIDGTGMVAANDHTSHASDSFDCGGGGDSQ